MTCERGCGRPGNEASVFTKCSSIAHLSISNVLPQQYSLIRARVSNEEDLQQMIICTGRVWCAHCALQGTTGIKCRHTIRDCTSTEAAKIQPNRTILGTILTAFCTYYDTKTMKLNMTFLSTTLTAFCTYNDTKTM